MRPSRRAPPPPGCLPASLTRQLSGSDGWGEEQRAAAPRSALARVCTQEGTEAARQPCGIQPACRLHPPSQGQSAAQAGSAAQPSAGRRTTCGSGAAGIRTAHKQLDDVVLQPGKSVAGFTGNVCPGCSWQSGLGSRAGRCTTCQLGGLSGMPCCPGQQEAGGKAHPNGAVGVPRAGAAQHEIKVQPVVLSQLAPGRQRHRRLRARIPHKWLVGKDGEHQGGFCKGDTGGEKGKATVQGGSGPAAAALARPPGQAPAGSGWEQKWAAPASRAARWRR